MQFVFPFLLGLPGRVKRSRCRVRGEGGTGGSRSALWKEKGGSSPQLTGTGIGELGVEDRGQSLS